MDADKNKFIIYSIMNFCKCSILFVLFIFLTLVQYYNLHHLERRSEKFYKKQENYKKVQDIFHDILPHVVRFEYIPDILILLIFAYMAIMNFSLFYKLSGFAFTLLLFRQLIIQLTVLPKNDVCNIKTQDNAVFRGGCYDKIFSGHFGVMLLTTLVLYDSEIINQFVAIVINFINAIFILLTRSHYTVDIVVSILVVVIIYQNNLNICEYLDKYF